MWSVEHNFCKDVEKCRTLQLKTIEYFFQGFLYRNLQKFKDFRTQLCNVLNCERVFLPVHFLSHDAPENQ